MTKIEMAQYIVEVLYQLDHVPARDHIHVQRIARRPKVALENLYERAFVVEEELKAKKTIASL